MSSNTYAPAIEWKLLLPMEGSWSCFHDGRSVCNDDISADSRLVRSPIVSRGVLSRLPRVVHRMFLFEIYSPDYGFRMPWIQIEFDSTPWVPS